MRRDKQGACCLNDVMVPSFRSAILRMSTGIGELRERAMGSKEIAKLIRKVFPAESERKVRMEAEN